MPVKQTCRIILKNLILIQEENDQQCSCQNRENKNYLFAGDLFIVGFGSLFFVAAGGLFIVAAAGGLFFVAAAGLYFVTAGGLCFVAAGGLCFVRKTSVLFGSQFSSAIRTDFF